MLSADRDAAMDAPASPTRIHTSMHREPTEGDEQREKERDRISALVHIARIRATETNEGRGGGGEKRKGEGRH